MKEFGYCIAKAFGRSTRQTLVGPELTKCWGNFGRRCILLNNHIGFLEHSANRCNPPCAFFFSYIFFKQTQIRNRASPTQAKRCELMVIPIPPFFPKKKLHYSSTIQGVQKTVAITSSHLFLPIETLCASLPLGIFLLDPLLIQRICRALDFGFRQ